MKEPSDSWKQYVGHPERHPFYMKFSDFNSRMKVTSLYKTGIPPDFRKDLINKNTLLRQILWRRERGMNCFTACLGGVRTSKSYFCLKYAELYAEASGKEFNVKKQVSFCNIPHFLKWSMKNTDSVYVLDEVQIGMSPRQWFSMQNRVFNNFCDVMGLKRNLLLMPFPNISYIDKHLRFLLNYVCRTIRQGLVLWWRVNTRHELGKTWLDSMGSIKFKLPTQKTIEEYEELKKEFTDQHLQESIDLLDRAGRPDEKELSKIEYRKARTEKLRASVDYMKYCMKKK